MKGAIKISPDFCIRCGRGDVGLKQRRVGKVIDRRSAVVEDLLDAIRIRSAGIRSCRQKAGNLDLGVEYMNAATLGVVCDIDVGIRPSRIDLRGG